MTRGVGEKTGEPLKPDESLIPSNFKWPQKDTTNPEAVEDTFHKQKCF